MTIINMCDVCGKAAEKEKIIRMVCYPKQSMATRNHDKSIGSKDVCVICYQKVFNGVK